MKRINQNILALVLLALMAAGRAAVGQQTNVVRSLTIHECIERALTGNLDVQLQRINPELQTWGIVHAEGAFDPALTGGMTYGETTQPLTIEQAGSLNLGVLGQNQLLANAGLGGLLPTGTKYNLTYSDTRASGTLTSNFVYTGTTVLSVTQPILKNFWFEPNLAALRVARIGKQISAEQFSLQLINTVSDTVRAYYELVFAIEDEKAKREDLGRAQALLDENRKRVQIGVMSPLDVTQAESGVASREQALILAARLISDNANTLKHLISPNVSEFRDMTFLPVDYPLVEMVATDVAHSTRTALDSRPDYHAAQHTVEQQNILVKFNHNQLWPELDLQASAGLNGNGTSYSQFTDSMTSGNNTIWTLGFTVTIPLGNRQARSNYRTAQLQASQSLLSLKNLEQQIVVAVDNAVGHVRSNLKSVEAARVASRLADESLKAEKSKLLAGASTTFLVLQAQSQLATAQSAEIRARADYAESLVELARVEGTTLRKYDIKLKNDF